MHRKWFDRICFAPEDGGTGGGDPPKRPDFVPEKFWTPELAKAVEVAPEPLKKVFASYAEAETGFHKKTAELEPEIRKKIETERTAKRPAKPDDYQFKIPDGVKLPEGVTVKPNDKHPMVAFWRKTAHDMGLDQAGFEEGIRAYVEGEAAQFAGLDTAMKELGEGDAAKGRIKRVDAFLDSALEDDKDYEALASMLRTSAQVIAFEKLMKKIGSEPDLTKFNGRKSKDAGGEGDITPEKLRALQNDPRYWKEHDPAIVKQVSEGYQKLYGRKK